MLTIIVICNCKHVQLYDVLFSNLSFCFIKYSTPSPVLYSLLETSLNCTVSYQHTKVHLPTIQTRNLYASIKVVYIYPSRNFLVSSFTSFSNPPNLHYFMPFRNISSVSSTTGLTNITKTSPSLTNPIHSDALQFLIQLYQSYKVCALSLYPQMTFY